MVLCFRPMAKTVLILTHRCFSCVKAFSIPHAVLLASRLGVSQRLGEDKAGTFDPNWAKGCSTSYNVTLSNKTGDTFQSSYCSETGRTLICWWEVVSDYLCIGCFFSPPPPPFSLSPIKLPLSQPMSFPLCALPILSPIPLRVGSEWVAGRCSVTGRNQPTATAGKQWCSFVSAYTSMQSIMHVSTPTVCHQWPLCSWALSRWSQPFECSSSASFQSTPVPTDLAHTSSVYERKSY